MIRINYLRRGLLSMLGIAVLLCSVVSTSAALTPRNAAAQPFAPHDTPCATPFVDIAGNIFAAAISDLYCGGVVSGSDATHYAPGGTSTRAQFAKVVVLAFALPAYTPAQPSFSDVPGSYFAYQYIESGLHAGILSGFDAATCQAANAAYPCYLPNRPITRGQLTRLVINAAQYPPYTPSGGPSFNDVPASNVFYASIETAYHNGIIAGYPDGSFRPNNNIRRDEMAQIVYQAMNNQPNPLSPTPVPPTITPGGPSPTPGAGGQVIGYFAEWGVYDRNYQVKNIVSSGSASKLTTINYAFSNIANGGCALGDTYADYDRYYDAGSSVSGVADSSDSGALRGSFHQLQELKALYPSLKVMISIGGWSWSSNFSDVALTAASRQAFVSSCLNLFIAGNFAAGLTYPGIFDGIDIDWEYPARCGETCNYRAADTQNYTLLLAEFRRQLDQLSAQTGHPYYLSIAAPTASDTFQLIELNNIHPYLDSINLMAYDMHGTWEATTNFEAPLYHDPSDPSPPPANTYYDDYAVQAYRQAGVPAAKLVLGIPFYGRGWTNVPNVNNGLYQPSSTPAPGTYEAGVEDYKVLKNLSGYTGYRQAQAQAFWVFNGTTFWSYDDPTSIRNKMNYVRAQGLGGAMFWEFSGDDDTGSLITAIYNGLH